MGMKVNKSIFPLLLIDADAGKSTVERLVMSFSPCGLFGVLGFQKTKESSLRPWGFCRA